MKKHLLSFLFLCVLLLTSCFRPIEEIISDGVQQLVIDNAFYVNGLFSCSITFDYYVTEDTCNVGGFAIRWDEHRGGQEDWYIMQKCIPGVRYTIQHTFRQKATIAPIVMMQGYKLNDCETYPDLIARDTLQIRTSIKT
ncbi:MAG: hypothetical protein KAT14_08150 [Candidatus Marinimicrobia bacterium]|nr:hypothetical protein [Candidatus Neomarinimicrobiota bacterium]